MRDRGQKNEPGSAEIMKAKIKISGQLVATITRTEPEECKKAAEESMRFLRSKDENYRKHITVDYVQDD